jgi:peptide/nickel transport system substrate-binding protein
MRSTTKLVSALLRVSLVSLAASTVLAASDAPLRIGVFSAGMMGLDPQAESNAIGLAIQANIFDQLLMIDNEGRQIPVLALAAERVGDRAWRFQLRQGVRFHNGAPFSSADVVASILRARDNPKSLSRVVLSAVSDVVAEGPYAVRIELRKRDAIFLEKLSEIRIVPKDSPAVIVAPIGTGPYKFVRGQLSSGMTLQAFDGYWGPAPREKLIELTFDFDGTIGTKMLLANQVDLVTNLEPSMVRDIEARDDLWVDSTLTNTVLFIVLNINQPPFDSSIVREAVDCAIDRQAIADQVYLKYSRPVSQVVTASARGYAPGVPPVTRNLARARALVSALAGEAGIPFVLEAGEFREAVARALARQLGEAGFRVEIRLRSGPQVLSDIREGSLQAGVMSFHSPLNDAGSTYTYIVHSQSPGSFKTSTSTPEIDRLIDASQDTLEPKARLALLYTIAERLAQRRGFVPLVSTMDLYGARRELQWKPSTGWAMPLATAFRQRPEK